MTPRRSTAVALLAAVALSGACTHDRYLGSLLPSGTYVNRGYGIVVPLGDLPDRWHVFDPEHPERGPKSLRAELREESIDLDGDGTLRLDELTARYEPPLRLVSRTSTTTWMVVQVEILSEPGASEYSLKALFDTEVRDLAATDTAARLGIQEAERRELGLGREARVTRIVGVDGGGATRLALIDQPGVRAESGAERRQLVRVRLQTPRLTPERVADHETLLRGLIAAREIGRGTRRERW